MNKRFAALLSVIGLTMLTMALMVSSASARTPAPGYEDFAGCPSPEENPEVEACFTTTINGGQFKMGSKTVPIEKPITFSGGFGEAGIVSASPKGGLTPVKEKVPGGIIGITGLTWLAEFLGSEALTLYATTELAGQPSVPIAPPLHLPIRVHLTNSTGVLGPNCYVGSFTNPINLNLITGTTSPPAPNKPITGHNFTLKEDPTREGVILLNGGVLVDNSFSAPGASGCVLTLFGFLPISLNGLVNSQSGLPSAAGNNEAVQDASAKLSETQFVYP